MHQRRSIDRGPAHRWLGALAVALGLARPVLAAEPPRPPQERAEAAWRAGRFVEAAVASLEAYRLRPQHTILLYNTARAFHRAQACQDALRWYRTYVDLAPSDGERTETARQLAEAIALGTDLDCPLPVVVVVQPAGPAAVPLPEPVTAAVPEWTLQQPAAPRRTHPAVAWTLLGAGGAGLLTGAWLAGQGSGPAGDPAVRDGGLVGLGLSAVVVGVGVWLLQGEQASEPPAR